jgi:glycosyltransferase involved in cell wall biosynthesis
MNILYVLHKDPDIFLGGIERHTIDLIRALSMKGMKVRLAFASASALVVRSYDEGGVEEKRFKGQFCNDMILHNTLVEKSFIQILKNYSIDIVHFQHILGFPLSLIEAAKHEGAKVIISVHDYFFWCPNYKLLSPLCNDGLSFCYFESDCVKCAKCLNLLGKIEITGEMVSARREYVDSLFDMPDAIVFFSRYVQDVFCSLFNCHSDNNMIIEHGIEIGKDSAQVFHHNHGLNIAYLGAFTYEKGADIFIEIIRGIKSASFSDKVKFSIIGELGHPPPDDLLKSKELKIIGAYRPHEIGGLLKREGISLILLLSRWPETYSYTLSEAIANGIPVIANDFGALRERVAKYTVGYLVPYENPVSRSIKIINDFLIYPELLNYFRQRCVLVSKEIPKIDDMVKKYISLYRR